MCQQHGEGHIEDDSRTHSLWVQAGRGCCCAEGRRKVSGPISPVSLDERSQPAVVPCRKVEEGGGVQRNVMGVWGKGGVLPVLSRVPMNDFADVSVAKCVCPFNFRSGHVSSSLCLGFVRVAQERDHASSQIQTRNPERGNACGRGVKVRV